MPATKPSSVPVPSPEPAPAIRADIVFDDTALDEKLLAHLDTVLADLGVPDSHEPAGTDPSNDPQVLIVVEDPAPLWAQVVADPGFAAEHLAADAVRRFGPEARDWVDRMRARYPDARPDALARLAVAEHTRLGRQQALASGSPLGAVVGLGQLGRTQASLVLTVAAVYGVDPVAPERGEDLLAVLRVPRLTEPGRAAVGHVGRLVAAWAVRRLAARLVPFGATVASVIHSGMSTDNLGRRAITRFRPR
jgi:hypothetical protein